MPLEQEHEQADWANMYSSSLAVEKVLSRVATPPASAVPNVAVINSARLVISTPTRSPLPRPSAVSACATSSERSHKVR